MLKIHCSEKVKNIDKYQRGDMLLESLIAMFLITLIGIGPAFVAARAAVAHKNMNTQNSAVVQLRNLLAQKGNSLCGDTSQTIAIGGNNLAVTASCTDRSGVQVGGSTITLSGAALSSIQLSVSSSALFGGAGTIIVGE